MRVLAELFAQLGISIPQGVLAYFVQSGIVFLFFFVFLNSFLGHRRVYPKRRLRRGEELRACGWSIAHQIVGGTLSLVIPLTITTLGGPTLVSYTDIATYGWPYLIASGIGAYLIFDFLFYIGHRTLHTRWLFRNIHYVHHLNRNPTPWARQSFHPLETAYYRVTLLLPMYVFPMHPLGIALFVSLALSVNILQHLGVETFPPGFSKHPVFRFFTTSTHHSMHHGNVHGNYSFGLNYDLIFGTLNPRYQELFDKVTSNPTRSGKPDTRLRLVSYGLAFLAIVVPVASYKFLWGLFS